MSQQMVATRYARALLDLGQETGQLEPLAQQIRAVADAFLASASLRRLVTDPSVRDDQRTSTLRQLAQRLGMSQLATNALLVIAQRRRLLALPDIAKRLEQLVDERASVSRAVVTSVAPLSEEQYGRIAEQLQARTRGRVVIERRQDPTLLAGVVTCIGDDVIDSSLKGRLQELERQLLEQR